MKKVIKQFFGFIGISGIGWIIDFIIYNILSSLFNVDISIANMISSLIGVTFVFIFSTRKIFENGGKLSLRTKCIIYLIYQVILILCVSKLIIVVKELLVNIDIDLVVKYAKVLAKILITPITMTINFVVMKYLVEKM